MQEFKGYKLDGTSSELKNEVSSKLRPLLKSQNVYSTRKRRREDKFLFLKIWKIRGKRVADIQKR